ncbi:MAG TPA: hypothetical protein VG986_19955 [Pseudolabrys sp.]|nr:hypothetical protein [Pseudolabrys sp.]
MIGAEAAAATIEAAPGSRFAPLAGAILGALAAGNLAADFSTVLATIFDAILEAILGALFGAARVAFPTGRRPDLGAFVALARAVLLAFLELPAADLLERPAVLAECLLMAAI